MVVSEVREEPGKLNIESVFHGNLTWFNIENPTERETAYLARNFPFHSLDLDDCLSRKQLPKIDEYEDYIFTILHFVLYRRATRTSTHGQISVFIGDKYLITLHTGEFKPLTKLFADCQTSEEARQKYLGHGSGYLLYRILDRMVDVYFPILDKIMSLVEDVEDAVFDENVEAAHELSILRRDINTQRRIIFPMRTLGATLGRKIQRFADIDMTVYYGDLMDHINKICETLDECKETIEVFKDADFLLSTYRLNRLSRVLTILGTILLPFLVISSIYGMNVVLPGGLETGDYRFFLFLLLIMIVIAGGMLFIFRRKHWI